MTLQKCLHCDCYDKLVYVPNVYTGKMIIFISLIGPARIGVAQDSFVNKLKLVFFLLLIWLQMEAGKADES